MLLSGCKSQYFLDFQNAYIKYPSYLFNTNTERNENKSGRTASNEELKSHEDPKKDASPENKSDTTASHEVQYRLKIGDSP